MLLRRRQRDGRVRVGELAVPFIGSDRKDRQLLPPRNVDPERPMPASRVVGRIG